MKINKDSRYNQELIDKVYAYSLNRGIYIDLDAADEIYRELSEISEEHKIKAIAELPEEYRGINLNSPKQIVQVMTEHFNFAKYAGKTGKGGLSFGEEVLAKIYEKTGNLFAYHLREYRSSKSIAGKIKEIVDEMDDDNRVHPEYVYGDTNRVSYRKPGLSNLNEKCRPIIAAGPGRKLIKADYKAQEVYIQVNMLNIPELKRVFEEYDDFYAGMVKVLANVDLKREYRNNIKTAWLAGIYNSSLQNIGESEEERKLVKLIKDKVHKIPQIEAYREYVNKNMVHGNQPVTSYFGTKRMLPSWVKNKYQLQNIAFNNVFQITGADILFFAIESCINKFRDLGLTPEDIYIYMTIHDEIIFNVSEDMLSDELLKEIEDAMVLDIEGWTKIKVDLEVSDTY